jgi:hypothetical protein
MDICPDALTAPRGCGLVRVQTIRDALGRPIGSWRCTFCAEQRRIPDAWVTPVITANQPTALADWPDKVDAL